MKLDYIATVDDWPDIMGRLNRGAEHNIRHIGEYRNSGSVLEHYHVPLSGNGTETFSVFVQTADGMHDIYTSPSAKTHARDLRDRVEDALRQDRIERETTE